MESDTVFVVQWCDRHQDDGLYVTSSLEKAKKVCKEIARNYDRKIFKEPTDWNYKPTWVYYLESGEEGPTISVREIKIDGDL